MNLLLDTHIFAWLLMQPEKLSEQNKSGLDQASARYLSVASIYEMGQKYRLGRWPQIGVILNRVDDILAINDIETLPIDLNIARQASLLPWDHRDPFDRMIVATAKARDLALMTADEQVLAFAFDTLSPNDQQSLR